MAFTTSELVIVALTIRNVCIAVIKQAIPETRTRTRTYDVRTILRSLSSGQSVKLDKQPGGSKEAEAEWDINETVFLFKVCQNTSVKFYISTEVEPIFPTTFLNVYL